jgi:hypothetical protein
MRAFGVSVTQAVKDKDGRSPGARKDAHVWHASLALSPTDAALGDGRWGEIAEQFVQRMGFTDAPDHADVRWAAIHHGATVNGSDHIHIAINLVREDGYVATRHRDFPRAQTAARHIASAYGLTGPEGPTRGTGQRGFKKGELESDRRRGLDVGSSGERSDNGSRQRLELVVRACAAAAEEEGEFVAGLRSQGVLVAGVRHNKVHPERVTGFRVALRDADGKPGTWYGGGRLSRELTLPRLRQTWMPATGREIIEAWRPASGAPRSPWPRKDLSPAEARRVIAELDYLRSRLKNVPPSETGTWAEVARETAGALAALSLQREENPGPIARAARNVARSAQLRSGPSTRRRWRSLPPARHAAQILMSASTRPRSTAALVTQIIDLIAALNEMHRVAGHTRRAQQLEAIGRSRSARREHGHGTLRNPRANEGRALHHPAARPYKHSQAPEQDAGQGR